MSRFGQRTRLANFPGLSGTVASATVSNWFGNQFLDPYTRAYGVTTPPVAWYEANDLSSVTTGTVWTNKASANPGAVAAAMTATQAGTLTSSWRNGQKALSGFEFKANISSETGLSQSGNFTMIVVAQTDGSGFGPFFGVGEWWGNYSQAYGGYYWHGLYGNWGHYTASPAVVGHRHSSGSGSLTVFSNGSYSSDSPGSTPDATPYISTNSSAANADYIAEIIIFNTVLSDADIATITTALRAKYSF